MKTHTLLAACIGSLVLAGYALAQEPGSASVMRRSCGVAWHDGVLRGGGPDYRVRFDRGGFEYTPVLGRKATASYPLRLTLDSIRRGDVQVWATRKAEPPRPRLDGSVVLRDRAPGIVERIALDPDGVELSYVIDRPLGGAGDLVVRLAVDTRLEALARDGSWQGLRFGLEGEGVVHVGGVVGIDAAGLRVTGTLRLDGRHLELVLPAAWIDRATYPVVLDPPIGRGFLVSYGSDDTHPAVAYSTVRDVYLVVWQRTFSASDIEVRAQRVDTSGNLVGGLIVVTSSSNVAMNPAVGGEGVNFLVAWQEGPSLFGPWDIRAAYVMANNGSVTPAGDIAHTAAHEVEPDVGSGPSSSFRSVVVWSQGDGIRARQVTSSSSSGTPVVTGSLRTLTSHPEAEAPAISTTSPLGYRVVAWQDLTSLGIALLDPYGNPIGLPLMAVGVLGKRPAVDGDGTEFLVAWEHPENFTGSRTDHDIRCVLLRRAPTGLQFASTEVTLAGGVNDDEIRPAVCYLGPKYLVAWSDEVPRAPLNYVLQAQTVDPSTCLPCGPIRVFAGNAGTAWTEPKIASRAFLSTPEDDALMVWREAAVAPRFQDNVWAIRYEAIGAGGSIVGLGGGCGLGGTLGTNGPFALGNRDFEFTLSGADPIASLALLNLAVPGSTFACGPCTIVLPIITLSAFAAGGSASLAIPIPCSPILLGGTMDLQWWAFPSTATPCISHPVSFSDRMRATLGL